MAEVNKATDNMLVKIWRQGNLHSLFMEFKPGIDTMEIIVESYQLPKIKSNS